MKRAWVLWLCVISLVPCGLRGGWFKDRIDKRASKKAKYELSVAAVFQNEAPWLKEWIEYHHMVGVQHFYLFNDRSDDNWHEVLAPYVERGLVEIWESPCPRHYQGLLWTEYQRGVISTVINLTSGVSKWVALIDVDEFLVPLKHGHLLTFLRTKDAYGGVYARWENFGTGNIEKIPEGKLLIETLIWRQEFIPNQGRLGKSIVQPHRVRYPNIHSCGLKKGFAYWDANPGMWEEFPEIKVFHYWARDNDFLLNVKRERAERIKGDVWSEERTENYIHMYNDVEDLSMQPYVSELRRRVFGETRAVMVHH